MTKYIYPLHICKRLSEGPDTHFICASKSTVYIGIYQPEKGTLAIRKLISYDFTSQSIVALDCRNEYFAVCLADKNCILYEYSEKELLTKEIFRTKTFRKAASVKILQDKEMGILYIADRSGCLSTHTFTRKDDSSYDFECYQPMIGRAASLTYIDGIKKADILAVADREGIVAITRCIDNSVLDNIILANTEYTSKCYICEKNEESSQNGSKKSYILVAVGNKCVSVFSILDSDSYKSIPHISYTMTNGDEKNKNNDSDSDMLVTKDGKVFVFIEESANKIVFLKFVSEAKDGQFITGEECEGIGEKFYEATNKVAFVAKRQLTAGETAKIAKAEKVRKRAEIIKGKLRSEIDELSKKEGVAETENFENDIIANDDKDYQISPSVLKERAENQIQSITKKAEEAAEKWLSDVSNINSLVSYPNRIMDVSLVNESSFLIFMENTDVVVYSKDKNAFNKIIVVGDSLPSCEIEEDQYPCAIIDDLFAVMKHNTK